MNINQALKEKNRLTGKINKLKVRLMNSVSWIKGNTPPYKYSAVENEFSAAVLALVELKTKLAKATVPIVGTIIKMAELKTTVELFKGFDVKVGIVSDRYSTSVTEYESVLTVAEKDRIVETYEDQIGKLQDELDKFNATTEI